MSEAILQAQELVKAYPGVKAVDNVSLDIFPGKAVFIVGPSGSGKSTFLRCLNYLEKPTSGKIIFEGERVSSRKGHLEQYRQQVGMVFQHFNLFPHLTVRKNITLSPVLTGKMTEKAALAKADELLERIGLYDKRDAYPDQLSGGQKQRIAIIRALAMNPKVLLFDEPTSALDPEMVGEVQLLMQDLAHAGMTMVVVTHEIGFAADTADQVVFMDKGQIAASGTPEEVIKNSDNPRIREFFAKVK